MTISQLLFSFQGRITRSTYWLKYILPVVVICIILNICSLILIKDGTNTGIITLFSLLMLAIIYPSLAISAKRCHDRGRSGWFLLLNLVPLVNIWVFIELGFLRGTVGDNQYGPDPLAQDEPAVSSGGQQR
jgi:uncharacterized membrane protein YhaH (DUF805 family)